MIFPEQNLSDFCKIFTKKGRNVAQPVFFRDHLPSAINRFDYCIIVTYMCTRDQSDTIAIETMNRCVIQIVSKKNLHAKHDRCSYARSACSLTVKLRTQKRIWYSKHTHISSTIDNILI